MVLFREGLAGYSRGSNRRRGREAVAILLRKLWLLLAMPASEVCRNPDRTSCGSELGCALNPGAATSVSVTSRARRLPAVPWRFAWHFPGSELGTVAPTLFT